MTQESMLAIDMALRLNQHHMQRRVVEHLTVCRQHAHKFLFDADASALLGRFSKECADLVILHRQFAMPPYDICYVEVDENFLKALYTIENDIGDDGEKPVSLGYMIERRNVYPVVRYNNSASIVPFMYHFAERGSKNIPKQPFRTVDWRTTFGEDKGDMVKISFILGSGTQTVLVQAKALDESSITENIVAQIENTFAEIYFDNEVYFTGNNPKGYDTSWLKEMTGDLRHVWAILLWLNSVPHSVSYTAKPAGARLFKGKRMALSAYNTVHIHLKGKTDIRHAYVKSTAKRDSPRRHDVRGTWCHARGQAQGCSHIWPETPDEDNHYICGKCGRVRWWRHPHQRGDASKGFIDKEYKAEI